MRRLLILLFCLILPVTTWAQGGSTFGSTSGGATTLDGLSDTVITSIHAGEVLTHNGTNVINSMTLARGTITTSDPWTFTQTWNAGGVTFRGKENVYTITAAAAGSTVERWMGGAAGTTELAYITAGGRIFATPGGLLGGSNTIPAYSFVGVENSGLDFDSIRGGVAYVSSGIIYAGFNSNGVNIANSQQVNWSSNGDAFGSPDVRMWRDAANILALRNSTNAQTFNLYYSYVDGSNRSYASLTTSSTGIDLAAVGAGTGWTNADVGVTPKGTGRLKYNIALVALGGGSAPTLGTIGGSGPATAGQNAWLEAKDSTGATIWIPVWK